MSDENAGRASYRPYIAAGQRAETPFATAAAVEPTEAVSERGHIPIGGDVELYQQMGVWAPAIAGFIRLDLTPQTPGFRQAPGVELTRLEVGSAALISMLFVAEPFEGQSPTPVLDSDLHPAMNSFDIGTQVDTFGDGTVTSATQILAEQPTLWLQADTLRAYATGLARNSTNGLLVVVLRVLPRFGEQPA